jgi:hypothetical protein
MVLSRSKNLKKNPIGEGQVQDPIPGHGSKIPAVVLGDTLSLAYIKIFSSLDSEMATDRGTISIELFF